MKLSSSASCGCCFCCYCRSWLTMLLMVSSVIHASPEMSTTKAFTSLNNYYQAMTEFAKLNAKLSNTTNRGITQSIESMPVVRTDTYEQMYRTSQPNTATQMATILTQSSRTPAVTTASSPEQIATAKKGFYETTQTLGQGGHVGIVHRSPTSGTSALTGDNYAVDGNVVIRTIDTRDAGKTIEALGDTGRRRTQITTPDGHNSIRNPSTGSRTEQQHIPHEATGKNTKHVSNNETSLRDIHAATKKYNEYEVQRTIGTQTPLAWPSSKSRQYMPIPTSARSNYARITPISSNGSNIKLGDVIEKKTYKTNSNNYSNTNNSQMLASTTLTLTHLQTKDSTLVPLTEEHNQLKRPALLGPPMRALNRHTRQAEDEQIDKCRTFIEGDPVKFELYSPDYPNDYPKNMNCTRVIIAPKGQIIRLDFRNYFNIEKKEDCKFDFLEIRDGQYGFSTLIGKFCGTDFPPEITSKERYLWLFFHSDESIEYNGFTAVYEFIDRSRDAPSTDLNCTIEKDGFEGIINSTDVPPDIKDTVVHNKIALDCMWRIQVEEKWKIQVKFIDFKLTKPNDCDANFLDIFPEQTVMPARVKNFCGSAGEGITSDSNILHMRFYAEQSAITSSFAILYTAFRDRGTGACNEGEYDCEDATCIAAELKCNGRDNCKFRWDEEGCKVDDEGQSEHMIIIITVFGLILGGMVITFLVNCVRKIMHDQKIIRDVPVLSDGIYHIDSFIMDAPKAAIFVGLQDDYKHRYSIDNQAHAGHENIMAIDMDDCNSSISSAAEQRSDTSQSDANSINCRNLYPSIDADGGGPIVDDTHFENDEFIIVPQVPQKLITSHCSLHSGIMILSQQKDLPSPMTTDSCNSSPPPSSCTANSTNSSEDLNFPFDEHIRQSKESKLDEMGRNSKTRSRDNISIVSPRQKHSQTSLQILDDVSNRYYREMEMQAKGNYKEKDPNFVRRHDMIIQTSLCSTDNSSTTTAEQPPPQTGACDMGCQTRESLFGTASLLRSKSKTPSMTGSHRTVEGVPPPPRFSTFGYDAAQIAAVPPPPSAATSTLSRRNMHLPQESIEAEHPSMQTHMTIMPLQQQQQQHRHLHHRPSQEVCHHHHQHQQLQKQTLPRHQHQHYQEQQHHHPPTGSQGGTMPAPGTTIVTAISTGSSAARTRDAAAATATTGTLASGTGAKGKHNKADESKIFIDIRNSAPDVIIMTSH